MEVPVSSFMDRLNWSRKKSVWTSTILIFLLGVPSAKWIGVLDKADAICNTLLILGGLVIAVLLGWIIPNRYDEDLSNSNSNLRVRRYLKFMLRWISTPAIAAGLFITLSSTIDKFN
tara:strand:- start:251 stop:601 length:351 start_codon:yes stop_codon:yes gene_type:complete